MKKIIIFLLIILSCTANAQDCEDFTQGTFEFQSQFGTSIIERKNGWQLEKSIDYGMVYLLKIEKIDECKYKLHRYKIIKKGIIPPSNITSVTTEITQIKDDFFYFKTTTESSDMVLEGKLEKKSNEVSEEFKDIITRESKR